MMKKRYNISALTISSSSNKWRALRRKIQIAHINNRISTQIKKSNEAEEEESEDETSDESIKQDNVGAIL